MIFKLNHSINLVQKLRRRGYYPHASHTPLCRPCWWRGSGRKSSAERTVGRVFVNITKIWTALTTDWKLTQEMAIQNGNEQLCVV